MRRPGKMMMSCVVDSIAVVFRKGSLICVVVWRRILIAVMVGGGVSVW